MLHALRKKVVTDRQTDRRKVQLHKPDEVGLIMINAITLPAPKVVHRWIVFVTVTSSILTICRVDSGICLYKWDAQYHKLACGPWQPWYGPSRCRRRLIHYTNTEIRIFISRIALIYITFIR